MKPKKPSTDFPLFAHSNGQWAKKVQGKMRYYGPWDNPAAALAKYESELSTPEASKQASEQVSASSKVSRQDAPRKPAKPHPDFPLYAHASGRWAKKILGKTHFFGPWAEPAKALKLYLAQKDDLLAGRVPDVGNGATVLDLVNAFLRSKKRLVLSGELQQRTWEDYDVICGKVLKVFGKTRLLENLRPADFERLRTSFAKNRGPVTLGSDITRARVLFNYAENLIDRPVRYGDGFDRPTTLVLRKARLAKGPRMFSAVELRKIIRKAPLPMKAMIYLGINCGFGNNDCAKLTFSAIDWKGGWITFPRPKTGVTRRCPLWPETMSVLRAAIEVRYTPNNSTYADRVFITKYKGSWEGKKRDNPISKEMVKILKELGLHRKGVSFYALRHTFQTIGEKTRDKDAVRAIMGHVEGSNDMSAVYSEEPIEDAHLQAVADYVRDWLLTDKTALRRVG
jgi:integrase